MIYFLDTNIFMYAAGREHPLKTPCVAVLRRVAADELNAVINTEVLQEILYRYRALDERERGLSLARLAVDQVAASVLPVTLADMRRAFELIERYRDRIEPRDAVHAAVMLNRGVANLISADTHFDVIEGIKRIEPKKAAGPAG